MSIRRLNTMAALGLTACLARPDVPAGQSGVFVVGIDGMDPVILQRLIDEGKMPNLAELAEEGSFQSLGTSNPPQSPVAWSSFVTGMDPGGHGIFDFVHRDPRTYHPVSSATPPPEDPGPSVDFFGYTIPLSSPEMVNNRGGTPWWDVLTQHGVDVEVYRIPGNFPTPPSEAKVLAGMGTVDIRGGYGTYTFLTDTPPEKEQPKGDIQLLSVSDLDLDGEGDTARGVLRGPPNTFKMAPGAVPSTKDYLTKGLTVHLDRDSDTAVVGIDGSHVLLEEGEWSDWVEVTFDALPWGLMPVQGTVRFYAKQLRPTLEVYASPVNISPAAPAMDITSPSDFAESLYELVGHYYTQGMPEETDALKDGVFDDDDYVAQVELVQEDTGRLVDLALDRFDPGDATFVYLSDIDLQCHMLWRHHDPKHVDSEELHPAYDPDNSYKHARHIERFYRDTDAVVGDVMQRLPPGTRLVVMSDHGFQPYTRKLHLNAWLRDNGYLTLKDDKTSGMIVTGDVDWSKTKAYGIGFNGLYLNLKGREAQGIVDPAEADALMDELSVALEGYLDPDKGEHVVLDVYRGSEVYAAARRAEGPDLVVGYNKGYGASDESTLGEITEAVIQDNTSRWSGNHLMDPSVVPGVVLSNQHIQGDGHALEDLTASLLAHYGIDPLPQMTGEPIF